MSSKLNNAKSVDKLILVDNLEVAFSGSIPLETTSKTPDQNGKKKVYEFNPQCFIEYQPKGNSEFENIVDLWIDNRKIGELRFSPRAGYRNSEIINFKYDNVQLYQQNFNDYIDSIVSNLGLKYLYINHIDTAIDCTDHYIIKFLNNYKEKTRPNEKYPDKKYSIRHKGKVDRRNMISKGDGEFYWGNKNSDRYIKIYNKLEELAKPNNNKTYIAAYWKANGMVVGNKSVERIELTLKQPHAALLDYKKINDPDYLASIMKTHCKNYFEFEQTYTNNHKKRKRDVTPINFSGFNTILLPKFTYEPKNSLNTEKTTLKELYLQYLQSIYIANDKNVKMGITIVPDGLKNHQSIEVIINDMLYKYPTFGNYYSGKRKSWEKEFNSKNEIKTGKLSIEEYFKSIELAHDLESNIVEEIIEKEATETEKSEGYKRNKRQIHELHRSLKNSELKKLANGSKIIERLSLPITMKIDKATKMNYLIRQIDNDN